MARECSQTCNERNASRARPQVTPLRREKRQEKRQGNTRGCHDDRELERLNHLPWVVNAGASRGGGRRARTRRARDRPTSTPASINTRATASWSLLAATRSGVKPSISASFTSAPESINTRTTASWPLLAAKRSGVLPSYQPCSRPP